MGRNRSEYYVNPVELENEIRKYKETKEISTKLGEMFILLATRYATKPNFSGYSYKEDFIGDAVLRLCEQIDMINLDHEKCNCFAYCTQTVHNVFIRRINREKKFMRTKEKLRDHFFDELQQAEGVFSKDNPEEN